MRYQKAAGWRQRRKLRLSSGSLLKFLVHLVFNCGCFHAGRFALCLRQNERLLYLAIHNRYVFYVDEAGANFEQGPIISYVPKAAKYCYCVADGIV